VRLEIFEITKVKFILLQEIRILSGNKLILSAKITGKIDFFYLLHFKNCVLFSLPQKITDTKGMF